MTDVQGFDPLNEIALIEADFENADQVYDYLDARLHLGEHFQSTLASLHECLLTVGQQSFVMISRCDPRKEWFSGICEVLEGASCENEMLVAMYTFTLVN